MSDVRALLKAKRQEARVQHPHASYTSTGQLRCTACEVVIKQVSAWGGHVSSKSHRENVAKRRTSQTTDQEKTRSTGKRKVQQDNYSKDEEVRPASEPKKRKLTPDNLSKPTTEHSHTFPVDFFSDPSRASIRPIDDDSSDEDEDNHISISREADNNPIDLEWQRFQQEMLTSTPMLSDERQEAFKRATVFAEPELLEGRDDVLGFSTLEPPHTDITVDEVQKSETESRKRKEVEEKELIMDRLLEEERAQEEADAKVVLLKRRLEALKKTRNEAKAAKTKMSE
jgi:zinc finger protein 830